MRFDEIRAKRWLAHFGLLTNEKAQWHRTHVSGHGSGDQIKKIIEGSHLHHHHRHQHLRQIHRHRFHLRQIHPYDLLLIDIKMPKIDGLELYEKIRKIDDKVKVWFITAYEVYYKTLTAVSSKSKEETILDRFIQKPIEINNLVKQIKSELD